MPSDRYNIVMAHIPGFAHTAVLADVARLLQASLNSLGHSCQISVNQHQADATNILIGYHTQQPRPELRRMQLIIYQLEQLSADERFRQEWLDVLGMARVVWDFSARNIRFLQEQGLTNVRYLPLGYHPALATIPKAAAQDVDILHYGSMNARRRNIMMELQPQCRLAHLFGVYGEQRDAAIARSKIVLNLRQHDRSLFQQVRVSYLLNNERFVLSEPAEDNPYEAFTPMAPYEQLVQTCLNYLKDDGLREATAKKAAEQFRAMRMEDLLRAALA
jgi:hypothetical protein